MKTAGWIFLILGIVSFLGAAIGSSSVFGPCFWIALGAFLIYRGKEKEKEKAKENQDKKEAVIPDRQIVQPVTDRAMHDDAPIDATELLTSNQKECAFCLIMFFAGFNNYNEKIAFIIHNSAAYYSLDASQISIQDLMNKHKDPDKIIDTVIRCKDTIIRKQFTTLPFMALRFIMLSMMSKIQ
ncbi:MAG: hypothetical protein IJ383_06345 [Bacteroidales bacterium]|nr:hypothetical protein [Bacteroidales bacterium]